MRSPGVGIADESKLLQLRNRDLQCFFDDAQPCLLTLLAGLGNSLEKRLSERVIRDDASLNLIGMTQELRNEVQIRDCLKEPGNIPKFGICADLLQVGLRKLLRIGFVTGVRAADDLMIPAPDPLVRNQRQTPAASLLLDPQLVPPRRRLIDCLG